MARIERMRQTARQKKKSHSFREQAKAVKIYGRLVAINTNSPLSCGLSTVRKVVRVAPLSQVSLGRGCANRCYPCNSCLIPFRRKRGDDVFETRIALKRVKDRSDSYSERDRVSL